MFVADGEWHHLVWTRRFKRITLTLDDTSTAQADLPGADSKFDIAQGPVVYVDIGGLPAGVSQVKGKCCKTIGRINLSLLRLSITCGLQPTLRFSLPSITAADL